MADLPSQIRLLFAQGEGFDSWINIVFLVVLAIGSAIAGIVKSAKAKNKGQKGIQPSQRPAPRPQAQRPRPAAPQTRTAPQAAPRLAARTQPPPAPAARPRPPARPAKPYTRTAAPTGRPQRPAPRPTPTAKPVVSTPTIHLGELAQPDLQLAPHAARPVSRHPSLPIETQQTLAAQLLSNAGPQDLKTAILYTEILGKPLSLRDRTADLLALQ